MRGQPRVGIVAWMLRPWSRTPWWVPALVTGGPFATGLAVLLIVRGSAVLTAVMGGVLSGAVFGVAMASWMVARMRTEAAAVGPLAVADHRAVERAATRGPAPADRDVREAAARLTEHRLDQLERQRRWSLPLLAVGAVLYAAGALLSSPWWWLSAAFFAAMVVLWVLQPRRLRRRLAVLTQTGPR